MNETLQIENRDDVVRDTHSKALLKTDLDEKKAWLFKKERNNKITKNENQINIMRDELNEVKSILSDIKTILEETK